ncbi:hypothetical protein ACFQZS_05080 [Mucilaginibacter calamicampi]|uniref:Uncharacterized protein n=1 Tax=Mucilaginibacter calamicampi TaxID=1302352 RepID=A0ABW2YU53_9SPHI
MKKIAIIAVLLLSTALTALSISRKSEQLDVKLQKTTLAEKSQTVATASVLATAD